VAEKAERFAVGSARGEVVQQVAMAYLHTLAAASEVENAQALLASDQHAFDDAHAAHEAGVRANLDELRAKVQLQAQQLALVSAENNFEKDLILLKREIGIDPGQKIELSDRAPFGELAAQTPAEVRAVALKSRQDYQNLLNKAAEYKGIETVYKSQRLPVLNFQGYYGVSQVNTAGTHGNFALQGSLSLPIFREADIRGNIERAQAQRRSVDYQLADLRNRIDLQIRTALLDVNATRELVEVSRSTVDLATRALGDETDRVNAGVDDNLPLVEAQATLADAETGLVESLYQYNSAKLELARAAGVVESQYREYLGK
jgi:outer membrane protein TolC